MKILIDAPSTPDANITQSGDATLGTATGSIRVMADEGEKVRMEAVVMTLANFFQSTARNFFKTHPCKDCTSYQVIEAMYNGLNEAEKAKLLELGFDQYVGDVESD